MTKIDLNGASSVVLPDGREITLADLASMRTGTEVLRALSDQDLKIKAEHAQAIQLYKNLTDPAAQRELAVSLVSQLAQSSPDELQSVLSAAGIEMGGSDDSHDDSSQGGQFDSQAMQRMVAEAVTNAVAPLQRELQNRDARSMVDKEVLQLKAAFPDLDDSSITEMMQLAADKSTPGKFRLGDAAKLTQYDKLVAENAALKEAKAKSAAMDMLPGLLGRHSEAEPSTQTTEKLDYSTNEGRAKGAESALMSAMSSLTSK